MCTRFVYNGEDTVTGFNFDIDLAEWEHKVFAGADKFAIGIRLEGAYRFFHGVNGNGNAGTLLYVHGDPRGAYSAEPDCVTVADLTERFVTGAVGLDEALRIAEEKRVVYAPDATMQAMLSDRRGRTLIVEPGVGYRLERRRFSFITNYSVLDPTLTRPYVLPRDNRYERAQELLSAAGNRLTVPEAFEVLRAVRMEGVWATRVSFVYSAAERKAYYALNGKFDEVHECSFE